MKRYDSRYTRGIIVLMGPFLFAFTGRKCADKSTHEAHNAAFACQSNGKAAVAAVEALPATPPATAHSNSIDIFTPCTHTHTHTVGSPFQPYIICTLLFSSRQSVKRFGIERIVFSLWVFPLRFSVSRDFIVSCVRFRIIFFLFDFCALVCYFFFFLDFLFVVTPICYAYTLFAKFQKLFFWPWIARMQKVMCVCL